jgi:hypothetical protein
MIVIQGEGASAVAYNPIEESYRRCSGCTPYRGRCGACWRRSGRALAPDVHYVRDPAGRDDRATGAQNRVRDAGRRGFGRGVASQPGAPVLGHRPLAPRYRGLAVLRLIVGHLVPIGAPLVIAVDDTLFRRCGRRVLAAYWGYDGSVKVANGNRKLSRGNTFVVAAVVVTLPFLDRPVALPVLTRLWRKGGPAKTVLARQPVSWHAAVPVTFRIQVSHPTQGYSSNPSPLSRGYVRARSSRDRKFDALPRYRVPHRRSPAGVHRGVGQPPARGCCLGCCRRSPSPGLTQRGDAVLCLAGAGQSRGLDGAEPAAHGVWSTGRGAVMGRSRAGARG